MKTTVLVVLMGLMQGAVSASVVSPSFWEMWKTANRGECHPYVRGLMREAYRVSSKGVVSLELVESLVWEESRCLPWRVSSAGARGLMQQMPASGVQFGCRSQDLLDPKKALVCGIKDLEERVFHHKSQRLGLVCWNWGHARVLQGRYDSWFARRVENGVVSGN